MDLQFDHILHAVRRPEETRRVFERQLGFHTVMGGVHPQWGTYNALSYFGLSYIEWIGIQDDEIAAKTDFGRRIRERIAVADGATQLALRTHRMDDYAEAWRDKGLLFDGPICASRTRPDGQVIAWRMLFPSNREDRGSGRNCAVLPFLIEWADDDETRLAKLRETQAVLENPPYRLMAIHVSTGDVQAWAKQFRDYFAIEFARNAHTDDPRALTAQIGDLRVVIRQISDLPANIGPPGPYQLDLAASPDVSHQCEKVVDIAGVRICIQASTRR